MEIKRGDIFYADLSPVVGSEQGGVRPVLIIQNNRGNRHSSTVLVAAITSKVGKADIPTHVFLEGVHRKCGPWNDGTGESGNCCQYGSGILHENLS